MSNLHNDASNYIDNKIHTIENAKELDNVYTEWSKTYDIDVTKEDSYKGYVMISKLLDLFSFRNKGIRILDIGAGTGLVANELRPLGYENIDALEPNEAMIKLAKDKKLYKQYFQELLDTDQPLKSISENSYDFVTLAGCFSKGHMNYKHIKQIVKVVKPGGFVILGFRHAYLQGDQKEVIPEIKRLEKEKVVEIRILSEIPGYYSDASGFMTVLMKV